MLLPIRNLTKYILFLIRVDLLRDSSEKAMAGAKSFPIFLTRIRWVIFLLLLYLTLRTCPTILQIDLPSFYIVSREFLFIQSIKEGRTRCHHHRTGLTLSTLALTLLLLFFSSSRFFSLSAKGKTKVGIIVVKGKSSLFGKHESDPNNGISLMDTCPSRPHI